MLIEKLDVFIIVYLDDIFICTNQTNHINTIEWVFYQLRKYFLYANLKKCCFYHGEVQFFDYVMSLQGVCLEDKKIKAIHDWLELQSVRNIQVFLRFAKFYQPFS